MPHYALHRQALLFLMAIPLVLLLVLRQQRSPDKSGAAHSLATTSFINSTLGGTQRPRPRLSLRQQLPSSFSPAVAAPAPATVTEPVTRRMACVDQEGFYQGRWVHTPNVSRPHTRIKLKDHSFTRAEVAFRKTISLEEGGEEEHHLPWNQYDFVPHEEICAIGEWNVTEACQVLDRAMMGANGSWSRRVLFVGDSMSFTMALSFVLMMGGDASAIITNQASWQEQEICSSLKNGPLLVQFIRNDALYISPTKLSSWKENSEISMEEKKGIDWKVSKPWTPYYEQYNPELVVLNLGMHIHSDSFFDVLLDDTLGYLKKRREEGGGREGGRTPQIVWRTTAAGHPECWEYEGPTDEGPTEKEDEGGREGGVRYEGIYKEKYTWHLIEGMNRRMERRVREVLGEDEDEGRREGGVMVMKLGEVLKERRDGHLEGEGKDCLHYHLPGPPDWWTRVFLEVLDEVVPSLHPSLPASVSA